MDPFYGRGQSWSFGDPKFINPTDPRAHFVGGVDYGADPVHPAVNPPVSFETAFGWTEAHDETRVKSYDATVTEILGSSFSNAPAAAGRKLNKPAIPLGPFGH